MMKEAMLSYTFKSTSCIFGLDIYRMPCRQGHEFIELRDDTNSNRMTCCGSEALFLFSFSGMKE
jgi:hypothetical protein